jgi:hypothetical protein
LYAKHPRIQAQRLIGLYLNRKGLTAQVIRDDLVATLGEEAIAYSTVPNSFRAARIIPRDLTACPGATSHHIDESDEAILTAFEETAFSSVRQFHVKHIYPKPRWIGDSMRNSGLPPVISDGSQISCPTHRRPYRSNVPGPF